MNIIELELYQTVCELHKWGSRTLSPPPKLGRSTPPSALSPPNSTLQTPSLYATIYQQLIILIHNPGQGQATAVEVEAVLKSS